MNLAHFKFLCESAYISVWAGFMYRHFKKQWPMYKRMFEWPKPEPWKNVKYHYLRDYCEDCDPIPEKKDGEIFYCPNCGFYKLTPQTTTLPLLRGSGITEYVTTQNGWYCDSCRTKWKDETIRKIQTKFHKANKTNIHGPMPNPSGYSQENHPYGWQSYRLHPGNIYHDYGLAGSLGAQAASPGIGGDKNLANLVPLFDKRLISGLEATKQALASNAHLLSCPKCFNKMAPTDSIKDDWYCSDCKEAWVSGSARQYQGTITTAEEVTEHVRRKP